MTKKTKHSPKPRRWIVPMLPRSADEGHRASTPLELFFDLVFVVAIAQTGIALHHELIEGEILHAIFNYLAVFFAIWWAWMNFTWFASAYDCDDVPYRIATFVQITGALILAAGVRRAFEETDYSIAVVGYVVMRLAMVSQYLRAGYTNPTMRGTAYRFAAGVAACQAGWIILVFFQGTWWHPYVFVGLGIVELLVPAWGERAGRTSWHPGHIAERYGLFTIIVLGESILSTSMGIQSAVEAGEFGSSLIPVIAGGLLILFAMWWAYFDWSMTDSLTSLRKAFTWGYGHFFVFASIAAVGAGLAVQIDHALHHTEISSLASGMTVAIPVAIYLLVLWALHALFQKVNRIQQFLIPAFAVLVLMVPMITQQSALWTGFLVAALLAIKLVTANYNS